MFHNVVIPRKRGITALLSSVIPPQGGILLNFDVNIKIPLFSGMTERVWREK
jgi:hypothetical protein